jgi:hypothetical protein
MVNDSGGIVNRELGIVKGKKTRLALIWLDLLGLGLIEFESRGHA